MKTLSLKNLLILSLCTLLYYGCNMPDKNKSTDAEYQQALKSEKTGDFYLHEGETDSAMKAYNKSLALYLRLADSAAKGKDSVYNNRISFIYAVLGDIYDTLQNFDSALAYQLKSLTMDYKTHASLLNRSITNYNISYNYKVLGDKKGIQTEEGKTLYRKGVKYALASCWETDSLGLKTMDAVKNYYITSLMYGTLGDTAREKFYKDKYIQLYYYLHPGSSQNTSPAPQQKSPQAGTAKPPKITNVKSPAESEEDYDKRMSKRLDSIWNSVNPGTVTYTQDGKTTTVKTVINNGVATITTLVDGVLKKTETRKVN